MYFCGLLYNKIFLSKYQSLLVLIGKPCAHLASIDLYHNSTILRKYHGNVPVFISTAQLYLIITALLQI